jgi:hypothetical protein
MIAHLAFKINAPLAARYEHHARRYGFCFASPDEQATYPMASTDQGNVSHEIPAFQAIYRIETPNGADNHTPEFAKVSGYEV